MSEALYELHLIEDNKYKFLLELMNEIVWEVNLTTHKLEIIGKSNDLSEYNNTDLDTLLDYADKIIIPEDKDMVKEEFEKFIYGNSFLLNIQCRIITKFCQLKWILVNGKKIKYQNNSENIIAGTVTDITGRKKTEEQIIFRAFHDQLTNLPNKAFFMDELKKIVDKAQDINIKSAVFYIDIDNFSIVNDSYGHNYGDVLLKLMAQLIKSCIRDYGMVARIGVDEFLVLIPDIKNIMILKAISKSILDSFQNPFEILDICTYVTTSIGIYVFQAKGQNPDQIFRNADIAIHQAKLEGKNICAFYSNEIECAIKRKKIIESKLQKALENDEFEIYYQPQINIIHNRLRGFEALIRWTSPELGNVTPAEFIPIAEKTGLINKIGEFVLRGACIQAKEWKDKKYSFDTISVNVSPKQLLNTCFFELVEKILEDSKLDPKYLEIEITEGTLIKYMEEDSKLLEKLTGKNIKVSIDDFGTGYSSLNYLTVLPISTLKIDKSFIDKICIDDKSLAIVECIISLSKKLGYDVIAEGVENEDQKNLLNCIGCTCIQGYYYCKPIPASKLKDTFDDKGILYA